MATTSPDNIWIPDSDTPMVLDTMFATLAASIQNGIGARVKKLESFVGCYLVGTASYPLASLGTRYTIPSLAVTSGEGAFASGVTVNNGAVTVPEAGIYTLTGLVTADRTTSGSAEGALWSYLFVNGSARLQALVDVRQNSTSGGGSNTISAVVKLDKGDTVQLAAFCSGYLMTVRGNSTVGLGVALTSRS